MEILTAEAFQHAGVIYLNFMNKSVRISIGAHRFRNPRGCDETRDTVPIGLLNCQDEFEDFDSSLAKILETDALNGCGQGESLAI